MVKNNYEPLDTAYRDTADAVDFGAAYLMHHRAAIASLNMVRVAELIQQLTDVRARHRTIYLAGNGGKCSLCSEWVNDLTVALPQSRFKAHSLMENLPGLTGASNDYGWDQALQRRFEPLAHSDDLLIMLSGSGESANIIRLMRAANAMSIYTVGIGRGGTLCNEVDLPIKIEANEDGPTEDTILALIHIVYSWFIRVDRPKA